MCSTRRCVKLLLQPVRSRTSAAWARNDSTAGWYRFAAVATSGRSEPVRCSSRIASPGKEAAARWPSDSERMCRWRIAAARTRQTSVGSSCVPKTAISSGARPPRRNVA